jgi:hypothetical protein
VSAQIAGDDTKRIIKRSKKRAIGFGIETVRVREQNRRSMRVWTRETRQQTSAEIELLSPRLSGLSHCIHKGITTGIFHERAGNASGRCNAAVPGPESPEAFLAIP